MDLKIHLGESAAIYSGTLDGKPFRFTDEEFINLAKGFQQLRAAHEAKNNGFKSEPQETKAPQEKPNNDMIDNGGAFGPANDTKKK